ncbi:MULTISPECIES: hypothetical protein [unclassified Myroides]|uniref:hypothetical protein n=1 Tax=unclassified Myroides TaxID=2642485 RepID=UPI003D2F54C6
MKRVINCNNVFLKYEKLTKLDFLISSVWIEYYQPYELELMKEHGVSESWIYENIFTYEENTKGNGNIYYAIVGEDFYSNRTFVVVKAIIIMNDNQYFTGYQIIVKKKPNVVNIYVNGKIKTLYYSTAYWYEENKRTLKSFSRILGEEVKSIDIITDRQYKKIVKPFIKFSLDGVEFFDNF